MPLVHVPLLALQRSLYDLPRTRARFDRYLSVLRDDANTLLCPPLVAFNPMGGVEASEALDHLIAIKADEVVASAVREAESRLAELLGEHNFQVALVLIDDARGGWTNRGAVELFLNYRQGYPLEHGWMTVAAWTSERTSPEALQRAVLATIYRGVHAARAGAPSSLADILELEHAAAQFAALVAAFDAEELDYTRQVLQPYLAATDMPTLVAALYGDKAARSLGFTPLGLSDRAGIQLAWAALSARG